MFNHNQNFSFKQFLPFIGISLCLGVLILLGGLYLYNQKSFQPQFDKRLPVPITAPSLIPTPTLAAGQKAIYTFYIHVTSKEISGKGIGLKQSDTGKVFTIDTGTFISLDFGSGKFHTSLSSPQDIFKCTGSECLPHSSPKNSISSFWVSHAGCGTISVTETN